MINKIMWFVAKIVCKGACRAYFDLGSKVSDMSPLYLIRRTFWFERKMNLVKLINYIQETAGCNLFTKLKDRLLCSMWKEICKNEKELEEIKLRI